MWVLVLGFEGIVRRRGSDREPSVWPIAVWWTNSAQEASAAARLLLRSNGENGSHPGLGAA